MGAEWGRAGRGGAPEGGARNAVWERSQNGGTKPCYPGWGAVKGGSRPSVRPVEPAMSSTDRRTANAPVLLMN
ncbi:hypothetical protein KCMC57_up15580 [Kitasatospora sp. CMC57]|uniref:Uncharacterized protein n=1 Tax=Kitasatospora sp. CMC57 TaxID=3231513 RepID=A0AB33JPJ9_9ACTN